MRSWQIFKIWGVPFKIHPYWFVILFIFAWSISNQVYLTSSQIYNIKESWLIGFLTSFFLLTSIIFHEIFRTFVSLNQGVRIKKITFYLLGAILQTENECQNAIGNIKIAVVRPVLSFLTSLFLFIVAYLGESKEQIFINIITRVSILNLFLGLLNLLPVGALDGGMLLKSIIWHFSGSKNKGRNFLNKITLFISISILFFGIIILFSFSFYYGFLLCFLGLFGINSSKSESQFLKIENILKMSKIGDLNLKPLRKIEFDSNFTQLNKLVKTKKDSSDRYIFLTNNGRWDGFINEEILRTISIKKWDRTIISDFKKPIKSFPLEYGYSELWKSIEKIEKTNDGNLLVLNASQIPIGILDRNKIGQFVLKKLGLNLSLELIGKFKSKNQYPLGIELPRIIKLMKKNGDV